MGRRSIVVLMLAGAVGCARAGGDADAPKATAEVVVAWNARALGIAEAEDHFLTLKGVRTAAMMHVAMHDALNAVEPRFASYALDTHAEDADPVAAAAQAAYAVVLDQFPSRKADLDQELDRWLASVPDGPRRTRSAALGREAAAAILKTREGDGWDREAQYQWHPMGPGVYAEFHEHSGTPQGFVFGAGWAEATPFVLERADQFRTPPPPAIQSEAYTRAYDEVRTVGRDRSEIRTSDQAHLAMWWKDFAENSQNRLARQLVADEQTELWRAARLFALLNMSIIDGYVHVFADKFHYNHWRPYTAIRWAANDGNPDTTPEPDWNNLHHHTYAFPSYPSAHGTVCAAAMTVFADTYGDDHPFTMSTPEVDAAGPGSPKVAMDPPTRQFARFSDAAMECAMSRVYLGIHFRYDSTEGNALGRRIGEYAVAHALVPAS
ncbi:MAG: vanadium-dependent haloperoxidase [Vicinamibacterales bacterium]